MRIETEDRPRVVQAPELERARLSDAMGWMAQVLRRSHSRAALGLNTPERLARARAQWDEVNALMIGVFDR